MSPLYPSIYIVNSITYAGTRQVGLGHTRQRIIDSAAHNR